MQTKIHEGLRRETAAPGCQSTARIAAGVADALLEQCTVEKGCHGLA